MSRKKLQFVWKRKTGLCPFWLAVVGLSAFFGFHHNKDKLNRKGASTVKGFDYRIERLFSCGSHKQGVRKICPKLLHLIIILFSAQRRFWNLIKTITQNRDTNQATQHSTHTETHMHACRTKPKGSNLIVNDIAQSRNLVDFTGRLKRSSLNEWRSDIYRVERMVSEFWWWNWKTYKHTHAVAMCCNPFAEAISIYHSKRRPFQFEFYLFFTIWHMYFIDSKNKHCLGLLAVSWLIQIVQ